MVRYGDPTHPNAHCFNFRARGVTTTLGRYPEFDGVGNGIGLHILGHAIQAVMFVLLAFGLYAEGKARAGHLFLWMAVVHMCQAAEHYVTAEMALVHRRHWTHVAFIVTAALVMFTAYLNTNEVEFFPYKMVFYGSAFFGALDMFATNKPWEESNAPLKGPVAPGEKKVEPVAKRKKDDK